MMKKLGILTTGWLLLAAPCSRGEEIDFSRQIRPLLSKNCFACHGPDAAKRKAKLRLDTREGAVAKRKGVAAVVPGKSGESELYARITHDDPEERMPPEDSDHELSAAEIALLKDWIDAGAKYEAHWAFVKPTRPALPKVKAKDWPKNAVDHFVLRRLEDAHLGPMIEADRHVLIRRLSFDLTGLPPTREQIAEFLSDKSEDAYEKLVDRVLASPHYGERWARMWMDLARYADTQGYEKDNHRTVWPWRDWVIGALNEDMPYDQFTIEQLAGDLLPGATSQQVLATVFHRNTMTNTEGGTTDEEFRVAAVKDRVDTTGLIWLGLSVGCAKCHSHKYDPISQTEYYQLFDFLNQTADADRAGDEPKRALPSPVHYAAHKDLVGLIAAERKKLAGATKNKEEIAKELAELEKQLEQKAQAMKPPAVPIMQELAQNRKRKTRLLVKGDFLSPGAEVSAGVPEAFHPMPQGRSMDRLGLAHWLMSEENPMTARVTANRIWARMFGVGLVETEEDFGTQGELPSHPELLDWLAIEFRDTHRWSLKKLCKTIVMSATYRQSSQVRAEVLKVDPRNRLLARGSRFRLEAEMIRDQALAVSGLLSRKIYGPPVMPLQPEGIWKTVYNGSKWVTSKGEDRHRRGLYTFARRTSAYPSFLLMDAGSGEVCLPRRIRTNTTTAALVTLNDPVYTEAAQALARRVVSESPDPNFVARLQFAFELVTGRPIGPVELAPLLKLFLDQREHYQKNESAALAMATKPLGPLPEGMNLTDLAALTVVANVLLNMDEILTKG
ncbi:MAG: DUF1553 domain-containing protein [Roseibacillus sp.]